MLCTVQRLWRCGRWTILLCTSSLCSSLCTSLRTKLLCSGCLRTGLRTNMLCTSCLRRIRRMRPQQRLWQRLWQWLRWILSAQAAHAQAAHA
jgi:hypothetical protein